VGDRADGRLEAGVSAAALIDDSFNSSVCGACSYGCSRLHAATPVPPGPRHRPGCFASSDYIALPTQTGPLAFSADLSPCARVQVVLARHLDAAGPTVLLMKRDEVSLERPLLFRTRLREDRHRWPRGTPP